MTDIQMISKKSGLLHPAIIDKIKDNASRLYQKIVLLTLTGSDGMFRQSYGTSLLQNLRSINFCSDLILSNLIQLAKVLILASLLKLDSLLLLSLLFTVVDSSIHISIKLKDGSTHYGVIDAIKYTR